MAAGLPPSPALDETIARGQAGLREDAQVVHGTLNLLKEAAGKTVAELAADAAFTGAFAPLHGNLVIPIGDSITSGGSSNDSPFARADRDWLAYASLVAPNVVYHRNAGIPSDSTTQMVARFAADVAAHSPGVVIIGNAGTNDANTGVTLSTFAANIRSMVASTRAIPAKPVLTTICPAQDAGAWRTNVDLFNTWLRYYAASEGIPLIDFFSALVDPATGAYLADYTYDGIHPSTEAVRLMGQLVADELAPLLPAWFPPLPGHQTTDDNNLITGGLFLVDTNADGLSDGMSKTGAGTASRVAGVAPVKGTWQRLAETTTGQQYIGSSTIATGWSVGDRIAFTGRVKAVEGTSTATTTVQCNFNGGSPNSMRPVYQWTGDFEGVFYIEDDVPSGTTSLSVFFDRTPTVAGTGYTQVAQLALINLTTGGVLSA